MNKNYHDGDTIADVMWPSAWGMRPITAAGIVLAHLLSLVVPLIMWRMGVFDGELGVLSKFFLLFHYGLAVFIYLPVAVVVAVLLAIGYMVGTLLCWAQADVYLRTLVGVAAVGALLYVNRNRFTYNRRAANTMSITSVPAMLVDHATPADFVRGITAPQKNAAFNAALVMYNKALLETTKNENAWTDAHSRTNFILVQVRGVLREHGVLGCMEAQKFLTLIGRRLNE